MSMQIMCSRGCGTAIAVTKEVIDDAVKHDVPLNVSHDICPRDRQHLPKYVITVLVFRHDPTGESDEGQTLYEGDPVQLTRVSGDVIAPTFADAFDRLTNELTERWATVAKLRHIAEENLDEPVQEQEKD